MLRPSKLPAFAALLFAAACAAPCLAQTPTPAPSPAPQASPEKPAKDKEIAPPIQQQKEKAQREKLISLKDLKNPTAEQLAEIVVAVYGGGFGRNRLDQVRRNGVENGHVTRVNKDGQIEEVNYERRFVRGESFEKDKIRLDQKMPSMEFALVYNAGRIWGVINGTPFTPREDATADFLSRAYHGIDALLRYRENGSTIAYGGRDKQKGLDLWILDLTDKQKHKTRYYISANPNVQLIGHVLWLEYEEPNPAGGDPVKYRRTFGEYRIAQGTLVPYRSLLFADGKQIEETRINTVTYGVRMDDTYFQNPQEASN